MNERAFELAKTAILAAMEGRERLLVAIDGPCTAGKTTLGDRLHKALGGNLFHADDFFLRPEQRTPQRFAEVGGNIDYERFCAEVLKPLREGERFSYRPFVCGKMCIGEPIAVEPARLNIVEGSYCMHRRFGDVYDLRIFLDIDPELQRERVLARPEHLQKRFFEEWIPMEKRYFEEWEIARRCDLVINAERA